MFFFYKEALKEILFTLKFVIRSIFQIIISCYWNWFTCTYVYNFNMFCFCFLFFHFSILTDKHFVYYLHCLWWFKILLDFLFHLSSLSQEKQNSIIWSLKANLYWFYNITSVRFCKILNSNFLYMLCSNL